jgi:magnesium transporter
MIRGYGLDDGRLHPLDAPVEALDRVVWLDLLSPTPEEEDLIEAALGIDVPTRDEMEEIEESSRLYLRDGALFMTANLPAQIETRAPEQAPVTFILPATGWSRCATTSRGRSRPSRRGANAPA